MPNKRFETQTVFITGGTSGIGAAAAELFLAEGANVFVTDLEERDITSRLGQKNVTFYKCDVSDPEACTSAVQACVEICGSIDVLFHNAGMIQPPSHVPELDVQIFQKVMTTNLGGLFNLAHAAIPYMRKQGKGNIVATASTSGLSGAMGLAAYAASKAGIISLIKTLALDHTLEGIRANAVLPGMTNTPMTAPFASMPALKQAIVDLVPMRRFAEPEEVGKAVLFLASEDAAFITGNALTVDGGTSADCSGAPDVVAHLKALQG